MTIVDDLAERHIQQALDGGEFDNLPGAGKPLELDDDSMIPPHLRAGYRLLKNANCLPPELQLRREIRDVQDLLRQATLDDKTRDRARRRLETLRLRLTMMTGDANPLRLPPEYRDRVLARFDEE
ncbi:DUF1992 domain-containing protein [Marinobacteraceae bacterium S3BR75-40.1]